MAYVNHKIAGNGAPSTVEHSIVGLPAVGVIKTAQTTAYDVAGRTSLSDGATEYGIAQSYTSLTTGQYTGTTTITVNAIDDVHTNNVVVDNVTGLMWQKDESPASYGTGAQGLLWDGTAASDEDVFEYCDQANIAGLSGHNDWRVPSINELLSIVNYEASDATPDSNYWSISGALHYYTSTSRPNAPTTHAICFSFLSGVSSVQDKDAYRGFVLLVRG